MARESFDVAVTPETPLAADRIDQRISERCLSLMTREFLRAPVPVLCADGFIAYLASRHIGQFWPTVWFITAIALQLYRYGVARSLKRSPSGDAARTLNSLIKVFAAIGLWKASLLPSFFWGSAGSDDSAFLATMVITGLAAGGVASAAGLVRALLVWGVPLFGVLIAGWLWRGGVSGVAVAVLLGLLFAVLLAYVRDQREMIEELVRLLDLRESLSISLQAARDKAEQASAGKTRFFAAASHDLRQPLHALSINATTLGLLSRRSDDSRLRDVSRGIDSALSQSQSLLDGLLDISRLDAHAVQANFEPVDVGALLTGIHDEYQAMATQKGLVLNLSLVCPPLWALTDADQLNRVIGNLVSNAVKFTSSGAVALAAARNSDERLVITVTDTGTGISSEDQPKVFEEFFQCGNQSRDRTQGLGLGLAIVKRTCELLDINLRLSSAVGKGTSFELDLKVAAPMFREPPRELPQSDEGVLDATKSYCALVIDDEQLVVDSVARYLEALGWHVRTGSSGVEGAAAIDAGFLPDVLVVDYRLRGETGPDVIALLRQRIPELPAVIITGDTAPDRLSDLKLQASEVLHKPVNGSQLRRALENAIANPSKAAFS